MSRVSIVERDEISEVFSFIEGYAFKPYSQYTRFDGGILYEVLLKEIQDIAADPESRIITLNENHRPVALFIAKKSGIESEVLHKKIYAITHLVSAGNYKDSLSNKQKLLRFFTRHYMSGIGMVSCRANSDDFSTIHALENTAYRYMDSLVTYAIDLNQPHPEHRSHLYRVRPAQKKDSTILYKIVRDSQFMGRFHNDPHISREESDSLYKTFIGNAMKGMGADTVLVAECDDEIAGFNTIENQNRVYSRYGIKIGSFVLNAVAPEYRNRGIYSHLMHESLNYLEGRADLVEIRTHSGNFPVHRVLPRIGFRLSLSQLTFHKWNASLVSRPETEENHA